VNTQDRANANNFALGLGSQGLQARGQDQSYNLGVGNLGLGYGNLGLGQFNADTQRGLGQQAQSTNQFQAETGRMGQGTNQFQAQTARDLGYGNLGLGQFNADTQRALGYLGQGTNQFSADTARMLGMGNLGLGQQAQNTNQYQAQTGRIGTVGNLGLGQQAQDTNFMQTIGNLGLGYGNLGLNQDIANNNFYTAQRGQDLQGLQIGAGLIGQGQNGLINGMQGTYNAGNQEFNAPWNSLQQYSNLVGPFMGLGQTNRTNQSYTYNPTMQWAGLGMGGASALGSLGWRPFS
jgi:hypothetical protein